MTQPSIIERPARRQELAALLQFVVDTGTNEGLDALTLSDLRLAVEEACTNLIEHAYPPGAAGPISLSLRAERECIIVEIRDRAPPFDPANVTPPDLEASLEDRPIGGLGWHLIRGVMDEVRYDSDAAGNRLTLVKHRARTGA